MSHRSIRLRCRQACIIGLHQHSTAQSNAQHSTRAVITQNSGVGTWKQVDLSTHKLDETSHASSELYIYQTLHQGTFLTLPASETGNLLFATDMVIYATQNQKITQQL